MAEEASHLFIFQYPLFSWKEYLDVSVLQLPVSGVSVVIHDDQPPRCVKATVYADPIRYRCRL
jgi:hypothetical protein